MADDIAIKVENVSKNFLLPHQKVNSVKSLFTTMFRRDGTIETQHALKNIDLEIKKGEFFGIVGRNGSGKSTLLKILAGIYQPTKGKVQVHGKLVPFIELGVGFNPELTGRENVYLNGALLGFSEKEVAAMYDDIVEFAELEKFMDQKLKNYSSGMQVRLAFSMATRSQADILLIDEVLAVGDADFQRKCFEYFKSLKKDKKTVVFVSHDMEAVKEYCDRALLIENSRVVALGETLKIAAQYTKMFIANANNSSQSKGVDERWGNFNAKSLNVVAVANDDITIRHKIHANKDLKDYIVGVRVRSSAGAQILGTNTKLEGIHTGVLKKGEEITIGWAFSNILSDGEYIIDVAVHENDGITVIEWWDEAAFLQVKKSKHLPYAINPEFTVNIL